MLASDFTEGTLSPPIFKLDPSQSVEDAQESSLGQHPRFMRNLISLARTRCPREIIFLERHLARP
jgi:hypothetical protein